MTNKLIHFISAAAFATVVHAAEFHVAVSGNDANPGTESAPIRTIQQAASLAQPGDVITVHAGVYRERISPPRGGESDARRIVYQAAPGETVEIMASSLVSLDALKAQLKVISLTDAFAGSGQSATVSAAKKSTAAIVK